MPIAVIHAVRHNIVIVRDNREGDILVGPILRITGDLFDAFDRFVDLGNLNREAVADITGFVLHLEGIRAVFGDNKKCFGLPSTVIDTICHNIVIVRDNSEGYIVLCPLGRIARDLFDAFDRFVDLGNLNRKAVADITGFVLHLEGVGAISRDCKCSFGLPVTVIDTICHNITVIGHDREDHIVLCPLGRIAGDLADDWFNAVFHCNRERAFCRYGYRIFLSDEHILIVLRCDGVDRLKFRNLIVLGEIGINRGKRRFTLGIRVDRFQIGDLNRFIDRDNRYRCPFDSQTGGLIGYGDRKRFLGCQCKDVRHCAYIDRR